jgi:TPP-dependent pyruvate/acetoin dehydrogenase alpha subunit
MTINNKDYELAWLIREFENELLHQFTLGNLHGTVHTCIGQEFSAISVLKNFIKGDCAISNHRGHGHFFSVKIGENAIINNGKNIFSDINAGQIIS